MVVHLGQAIGKIMTDFQLTSSFSCCCPAPSPQASAIFSHWLESKKQPVMRILKFSKLSASTLTLEKVWTFQDYWQYSIESLIQGLLKTPISFPYYDRIYGANLSLLNEYFLSLLCVQHAAKRCE